MRRFLVRTVLVRVAGRPAVVACTAVAVLGGLGGCAQHHHAGVVTQAQQRVQAAATTPQPTPSATPTAAFTPPPVAPGSLPVIGYSAAPAEFPPDPQAQSTQPLTEALQPTEKILAYDAPAGRPRAYLAPTISGVPLIMPIAARQPGWVAVLLPSANRTVAWVTTEGWTTVAIHDELLVRRGTNQLTWYRDGTAQQTWTVALGASNTPTPLGRTFVLGRSHAHGEVYAGVDVLALGDLPDRPDQVATGLQGAHIGIHAWYRNDVFGKKVSNGCVRVPKAVQQTLLASLAPGAEVVVVD